MAFVDVLSQIKLLFGPLVIQLACYILETIIHLSVGESGGQGWSQKIQKEGTETPSATPPPLE